MIFDYIIREFALYNSQPKANCELMITAQKSRKHFVTF